MEQTGASVVITHEVKQGKHEEYENWLNEIRPLCRQAPGNMDMQIVRPIPGLTFTYTVIIRFDTIANLKAWMESDTRKKLIEKATPLFAKNDRYVIKSGLEFLFAAEEGHSKAPVRWKQWLVTWSAIFPLSIIIPKLVLPLLQWMHFPVISYLNSLIISGTIVCIMVYWLMPNYTRLIKKWLYE